jgi:predicted small metal-binding protein
LSTILIDGVKYRLKKPADERELEEAVKEHSKEIFGQDSIYFDLKHKLSSKAGVTSIPDGYVLSLSEPYKWYIVEVELSYHPLHEHITTQLNSFYVGIKNVSTQKELVDLLYREISDDKRLKAYVVDTIGTPEVKSFLSDLISESPKITVIIEEMGEQVREACDGLKVDPIVRDFKTYVKEKAPNIQAHLFNPIAEALPCEEGFSKGNIGQKKSGMLEYAESDELKRLLSECFKRFDFLNLEMKPVSGPWISVWYKGKRFMFLGARKKFLLLYVRKTNRTWLPDVYIRGREDLENAFTKAVKPTLRSME